MALWDTVVLVRDEFNRHDLTRAITVGSPPSSEAAAPTSNSLEVAQADSYVGVMNTT
jgi:hypothetical protein